MKRTSQPLNVFGTIIPAGTPVDDLTPSQRDAAYRQGIVVDVDAGDVNVTANAKMNVTTNGDELPVKTGDEELPKPSPVEQHPFILAGISERATDVLT
ncbi:MAG: hypothetical protein AAFP90_14725, partial [Planctomycetota bacterium]